jgi:hypothetical protein
LKVAGLSNPLLRSTEQAHAPLQKKEGPVR